MRRRVAIAGLLAVSMLFVPVLARAQAKPTSQKYEYSVYEKQTIARALSATKLQASRRSAWKSSRIATPFPRR